MLDCDHRRANAKDNDGVKITLLSSLAEGSGLRASSSTRSWIDASSSRRALTTRLRDCSLAPVPVHVPRLRSTTGARASPAWPTLRRASRRGRGRAPLGREAGLRLDFPIAKQPEPRGRPAQRDNAGSRKRTSRSSTSSRRQLTMMHGATSRSTAARSAAAPGAPRRPPRRPSAFTSCARFELGPDRVAVTFRPRSWGVRRTAASSRTAGASGPRAADLLPSASSWPQTLRGSAATARRERRERNVGPTT